MLPEIEFDVEYEGQVAIRRVASALRALTDDVPDVVACHNKNTICLCKLCTNFRALTQKRRQYAAG